MTTTTLLLVNAALALGLIGALAAVSQVALRMRHAASPETLHPSQPIPLRLIAAESEAQALPRAA
jgi:hypothetical protein